MAYSGITVLVVEDLTLIRMDIVEFLQDEGFTVHEASNADDAIAILTVNPDIRVLFTGIDMPASMDGLKLAAAVRNRWPPVKTIVTSGHRHLSDALLPVQGKFFDKPYDHARIVSAMREMVSAG